MLPNLVVDLYFLNTLATTTVFAKRNWNCACRCCSLSILSSCRALADKEIQQKTSNNRPGEINGMEEEQIGKVSGPALPTIPQPAALS
jgi:hypothetical protein